MSSKINLTTYNKKNIEQEELKKRILDNDDLKQAIGNIIIDNSFSSERNYNRNNIFVLSDDEEMIGLLSAYVPYDYNYVNIKYIMDEKHLDYGPKVMKKILDFLLECKITNITSDYITNESGNFKIQKEDFEKVKKLKRVKFYDDRNS